MPDTQVDDSGWPLVQVRWSGMVTDEEVAGFLDRMDRWLGRRERFALLIDSRGAKGLGPGQRTMLVNHMKANSGLTSLYLIQALVMDNPIQRALYHAVNWFFPLPFPNRNFGDPAQARLWLEAQLQEAPVPPHSR